MATENLENSDAPGVPPENGGEGAATPSPADFSLDDAVGEVSQSYEGFDPSQHAVKDGKPVFRSDGSYAKKRGRKPQASGAPPTEASKEKRSAISKKQALQENLITNHMAAVMLVNGVLSGMVNFVGPEWAPANEDEGKQLLAVVETYINAKGQIELSPEAILALTIIPYAAKRFEVENTRNKFAGAWGKLKSLGKWSVERFSRALATLPFTRS